MSTSITWVILTQGTRPVELRAAIESVRDSADSVVVVFNGADPTPGIADDIGVVCLPENAGIPGGRDEGVKHVRSELVAFLDDDARLLSEDAATQIGAEFARHPDLGALSFRIVDETGASNRRHVPRVGSGSADRSGPVATFLGGACVMRVDAYRECGRYWSELFYAHEELDVSWRMHDAGFSVRYQAGIVVEHPATPISRHPDGWRRTGRNRVMVARRNLPWVVAAVHSLTWLALGIMRAPGRSGRGAYVAGWWAGWRAVVPRKPIAWSTVWRLALLGRPPII